MAVTDRLTGLFNRVRLEEALNAEYEKAQRFSRGFGVIIIDVDDFKSVNDTYGHNVGDKVLVSFSNILKENTRAADTVGRWGGEEFLIVACETDLDGAVLLAEKLKAAIEAFDFPVIGKKTASFGVAVLKAGEEIKDLIARADQGLYSAKNSGRNRVGKMM
jgi:diguanylate cyclase (GGDEF)-like protein